MAINDKEELKERVKSFLADEPLFDPKENISVMCDEGDVYYILYGTDIQSGVAGFGVSPEGAFSDFIDNWNMYRKVK